ncbi:hypothetical protein JIQ42_03384 [Leishmania sp. Namibia]|uniref:hypothetical protein n=1 Tax=Leishmania sp. Namibia TaxID=2802991 RepID=UPI001B6DF669|nr:hypothetical protein JIQ42_03384 [Leishmania sp. Namibia]
MEDSPPPQPYGGRIGLFSSEDDSSHSLELHYEAFGDTEATPTQPPPEEPRAAVYATRRSVSGVSPRLAASHNGRNSINNSPRPSFANMRLSSACDTANGASPKGTRLSLVAMAASFAMPARSLDSMSPPFLPRSPQYGESSGNEAASAHGEQANDQKNSHGAAGSRQELVLHSPASLSRRRRQPSKSLLHRSPIFSSSPVNTTVSDSPERPDGAAAPAASMQADVKRYVNAVVQQHTMALTAWEKRVFIAEAYRDKPLRTGGRPAPVRSQDLGFLERIEQSLDSYLQELEDAKLLLLQRCEEVLRTMSGRQSDVVEWQDYCSRFYHILSDLAVRENLMRFRLNKVLSAGREDFKWPTRTRTASSRASSPRGTRSCSRGSASARASLRPASRGASKLTTPRQQTPTALAEGSQPSMLTVPNGVLSPYARHPAPATVVRRGNGAIRPGHNGGASPVQTSPVSVDRVRRLRPSGDHNSGRRNKSPTSQSSGRAFSHASQRQRLLPLHTAHASPRPSRPGNIYDTKTPYERLSPQRLTVSSGPLRGLHCPMAALRALDGEDAESCNASPARDSPAPSPTGPPASASPQLCANSSPPGSAAAKTVTSAVPALDSFRHRQLLETIDHFEKNASTLQRDDLQRARACFYELYGEQTGLHEYCQWIDNVAIKALHGA